MQTKLSGEEYVVESNLQSEDMGVPRELGSKIVNLLLYRQYSLPLEAVVRELLSNAYDAHSEANIDRPVDVTLPSQWDTAFSVRDYGSSMSHEFMTTRYCDIGFSSKEKDMNQIGAFGLGRFVPLLITDQYIVVTYRGGEARTYIITVEGKREPKLLHTGIAVPTEEEDGTKVSVIVEESMWREFHAATQRWGAWWSPQPNVQPKFQWKKTHWDPEDYQSMPIYRSGYYNTEMAVVVEGPKGGVLYSLEEFQNVEIEGWNSYYVREMLRYPLLMRVPVGSLDILPSREGIEYSSRTIECLREKFKELCVRLEQTIEKELEECNNVYEAAIRVQKSSLPSQPTLKCEWKGVSPSQFLKGEFHGFLYHVSDQRRWSLLNGDYRGDDASRMIRSGLIKFREKWKLYLADPDLSTTEQLQRMVYEKETGYLLRSTNEEEHEEFRRLGIPYASILPPVPKVEEPEETIPPVKEKRYTPPKGYAEAYIWAHDHVGEDYLYNNCLGEDIQKKRAGEPPLIYIRSGRGKVLSGVTLSPRYDVAAQLILMRGIIPDKKLYLIPERVPLGEGWMTLDDYIQPLLRSHRRGLTNTLNALPFIIQNQCCNFPREAYKELKRDGPMRKWIEASNRVALYMKKNEALLEVAKFYHESGSSPIESLMKEAMESYPLAFVSVRIPTPPREAYIKYVKGIDLQRDLV